MNDTLHKKNYECEHALKASISSEGILKGQIEASEQRIKMILEEKAKLQEQIDGLHLSNQKLQDEKRLLCVILLCFLGWFDLLLCGIQNVNAFDIQGCSSSDIARWFSSLIV